MLGSLSRRTCAVPAAGGWSSEPPRLVLSALVAVGFSTVLVARGISDAAFGALIVSCVLLLVTRSWRRPLLPEERRLHAAFIGYVAVAAVAGFAAGADGGLVFRYSRFLLFVPFLLLFVRVRLADWALWLGMAFGAIFAAGLAIHQAVAIQSGTVTLLARAEGESYAILFGDLSLAWGVMGLAGMRWFRRFGRFAVLVPALAAVAGLIASILSATRGGWIALPAMLGLLLAAYWPELRRKTRGIALAALVLVPALAYVIPATGVAQRFDLAASELHDYLQGKREYTSTGLRLEMWRIAWGQFRAHPLLGAGLDSFYPEELRQIAAGHTDPRLAQFHHPHNEYLLALSSRGVPGLAVLLALFLVPMRLFAGALRMGGPTKDVAVAGLLFIIGFMHFALTESIFERALFVSVYLFVIALIGGMVLADRRAAAPPVPKPQSHETVHSPL